MAMSMNKVYLSGRIKSAPYSLPGRHRTVARFLMYLPRERNRQNGDPGTVLVEAAGRNATRLLKHVKANQFVTVEGRLRAGVVMKGEEKIEVMLVRLENFSINVELRDDDSAPKGQSNKAEHVLPLKVDSKTDAPKKGQGDNSRRSNDGGRDNSTRSKKPRRSKSQRQARQNRRDRRQSTTDKSPDASKPVTEPQSTPQVSPNNEKGQSAPAKAAGPAKTVTKTAETKGEAATQNSLAESAGTPIEMPELKPLAGDSLKSDMPF